MGLYVPLDVNFPDDDRVLACSVEAQMMYVRSLCLVKRTDSDGIVSQVQLRRLSDGCRAKPAQLADELVGAGLWSTYDTGFLICAWVKHNPTSDDLKAKREANAERQRRARERKAEADASRVTAADVTDASRVTDTARNGPYSEVNSDSEVHGVTPLASPSDDVERVCSHLAARMERHHPEGKRPRVTQAWRADVDLLLRRGELGVANASPWPVEEAVARIDAVFDTLDVRNNGFCWADQIQSPGKLREKWSTLATQISAAKRGNEPPRVVER